MFLKFIEIKEQLGPAEKKIYAARTGSSDRIDFNRSPQNYPMNPADVPAGSDPKRIFRPLNLRMRIKNKI